MVTMHIWDINVFVIRLLTIVVWLNFYLDLPVVIVVGNADVFGVPCNPDDFASFFQNLFGQELKLEMSVDDTRRGICLYFFTDPFQKSVALCA